MSDDAKTPSDKGENEKNKLRDNAWPELKPKLEPTPGIAPRGSVGMSPAPGGSGPGLTLYSASHLVSQQTIKHQQIADRETPDRDERLIAVSQGDAEVDRHYSKEYRMIDQKEFDRLTQKAPASKNQNSRFGDENYRPLAKKTGDKEVDVDAAEHNHVVEPKEFERLKKEAIKAQLRNDRSKGFDRDR